MKSIQSQINSPLDVGWVWLFIFHISVLHYKKLLLNWYTEHRAPWLRKTSYVTIITYISQIKVVFGKFTFACILSNTRRANTSINYYKHSSYSCHFHDHTQNVIMKMYHPIIQHFLIHYYLSQNVEQGGRRKATYEESIILGDVETKCSICLAKAWDDHICT